MFNSSDESPWTLLDKASICDCKLSVMFAVSEARFIIEETIACPFANVTGNVCPLESFDSIGLVPDILYDNKIFYFF